MTRFHRSLLGIMAFALMARAAPGEERPTRPSARFELSSGTATPLLVDARPVVALQKRSDDSGQGAERFVPPPSRLRVGLEVLVGGRILPTISHAGKTYVPVREPGTEYEIRVWNYGPRRVTAVVSVDGLSVITGQPASENGLGYVLAPNSHVVIRGWRRSLQQVAAFRFVDKEHSYAAQMGRPENIGVIGLVAFEEQSARLPFDRLEKNPAAGAPKARTAAGSIGTEYGRDLDSQAYYVPFVRSGHKQAITLHYDTVEALRAAGVPIDSPAPVPFPADVEFAPPPPRSRPN